MGPSQQGLPPLQTVPGFPHAAPAPVSSSQPTWPCWRWAVSRLWSSSRGPRPPPRCPRASRPRGRLTQPRVQGLSCALAKQSRAVSAPALHLPEPVLLQRPLPRMPSFPKGERVRQITLRIAIRGKTEEEKEKKRKTKCQRGCGEIGAPCAADGTGNCQRVENNMAAPQKAKGRLTQRLQQPHAWVCSQGDWRPGIRSLLGHPHS